MTLSPKLGVVGISTLWHFRLPLPIQMFIKVASSPRLSGIGMPSPILWSHPLQMQRIVLLSSLLWWELGTNSLITGPGEWLSFRRFTSKLSWSWSWSDCISSWSLLIFLLCNYKQLFIIASHIHQSQVISPKTILSVNCLQNCRWTVFSFVGELSPKSVSVNCLVGCSTLNALNSIKTFRYINYSTPYFLSPLYCVSAQAKINEKGNQLIRHEPALVICNGAFGACTLLLLEWMVLVTKKCNMGASPKYTRIWDILSTT